jgi:hypothetical protein
MVQQHEIVVRFNTHAFNHLPVLAADLHQQKDYIRISGFSGNDTLPRFFEKVLQPARTILYTNDAPWFQ